MKFKAIIAATLAVLTLIVGTGLGVSLSPASAAVPANKDHAFKVDLSGSTAVGGHPDVTTVLTLCTDDKGLAGGPSGKPVGESNSHECAATNPAQAFFDQATATNTGILPSPQAVGARVSTIGFDIEANGGVIAGGQPAPCGTVIHLTPPSFAVWNGAKSGTVVGMDPAGIVGFTQFAQDQVDDPGQANGGDALQGNGWPKGVKQVPSVQIAVQALAGIPDAALISRGYGVAVVVSGVSQTTVTFLTVATGGNVGTDPIANINILGNPFGTANPTSANSLTCPPFSSKVQQLGTSLPSDGSTSINGTILTGPLNLAPPAAGAVALTICGASCTAGYTYNINLSSTGDDDNDGVTNAADSCPTVSNAGGAEFAGIGTACAAGQGYSNSTSVGVHTTCVSGGNPTAPGCADVDGDGFLNAVDNCPFVANPTQKNFDGDSRGDACEGDGTDPNPAAPANITNATASVRGTGAFATTDQDDLCLVTFVPGGSLSPSTTCIAFTGAAGPALAAGDLGFPGPCTACLGPGVNFQDSNDDGVPDFLLSSPTTVKRDHKADANNDGYSDADEGTPANCGVASCSSLTTAGTSETDTCASTGTGCGTGTIHTLRIARIAPGDGGTGCLKLRDVTGASTTANLARADVDLDGSVSILDLSVVAGWFNNPIGNATDPRNEGNMDGDGSISILDLSAMADNFNRNVDANCKVQ